jgi:cytochrome c553
MNKALTLSLALAGLAFLSPTAAWAAGDVKAGEQKAAMCIGCHGIPGYQASFPEVHRVPMISGQNAEYIVASLQAYAKGERKHPTMRGISASLSEQDMADLGAFYQQHGKSSVVSVSASVKAPPAATAALLEKGACASCHGADFNKAISPAYPKIAGQHADYLYVALKAYKVEGKSTLGRANAIMGAQVKAFTSAELKAMAQYIGSLPGDLRTVSQSRFR